MHGHNIRLYLVQLHVGPLFVLAAVVLDIVKPEGKNDDLRGREEMMTAQEEPRRQLRACGENGSVGYSTGWGCKAAGQRERNGSKSDGAKKRGRARRGR
jgi:hypothetical protein